MVKKSESIFNQIEEKIKNLASINNKIDTNDVKLYLNKLQLVNEILTHQLTYIHCKINEMGTIKRHLRGGINCGYSLNKVIDDCGTYENELVYISQILLRDIQDILQVIGIDDLKKESKKHLEQAKGLGRIKCHWANLKTTKAFLHWQQEITKMEMRVQKITEVLHVTDREYEKKDGLIDKWINASLDLLNDIIELVENFIDKTGKMINDFKEQKYHCVVKKKALGLFGVFVQSSEECAKTNQAK